MLKLMESGIANSSGKIPSSVAVSMKMFGTQSHLKFTY